MIKKTILGVLLVCSLAFGCDNNKVETKENTFSVIRMEECYVTGYGFDASAMSKIVSKYKKNGYILIRLDYVGKEDIKKAIMIFGK